MERRTIAAFAIIASCVIVGISVAVMKDSLTIPNHTQITTVNIEAYWDAECVVPVSSIDWNALGKGQSNTKDIYLRNEGSVTVILSLTTENWNPTEAESYMDLTWDSEGQLVVSDEVRQATLTLSALADIPDIIVDVYFDATITGTEQ